MFENVPIGQNIAMHPFLFALLGLGGFILLAGGVSLVLAVNRAPSGFENESGFRFAREDTTEAPVVERLAPQSADTRLSA